MAYEVIDDGRYEVLDPVVSVGRSINKAQDSIPRQVGLTARYGLEGLANTLQIGTEPIRYITDRLTGSVGKTKPLGAMAADFADFVGLPKPETPTERVIGDATRLLAGTGGTLGAGNLLQKGAAKQLGEMLTAAPVAQAAGSAGAGLAGGASREAGGSDIQQGIAALGGGLAGMGAVSAASSLANKAASLRNAMMTPKQMDVKISAVLDKVGVDYSAVPERVKQALRSEVSSALKSEQNLDPAAVARLLDFKRAGLTPTRGSITLDPVQITREKNLAKMAANSADAELHGLPRIQNQNNAKLISGMNEIGANSGDVLRAGEAVNASILGQQASLRGAEQAAWSAAKSSPGYKQQISAGVLSDINRALDDEGLMPFMSPSISKYIDAFQSGQPFTPQAYRNLQSMLSREVAKGGNEGAAAGLASRMLRDAELKPAGFSTSGSGLVTSGMAQAMQGADNASLDAISAVNNARNATRAAYAFEESSPLIKSVLSEGAASDPQRIAQRFVIGGTADEATELARNLGPQGMQEVKNALLANLKSKALNGASDEVGNFSQSAFNKALSQIGERKLSLFFSKEEIDQLHSMGRAASYLQVQPVGSAVNNSNSGALLLGRGMDLLEQLPIVGPMTTPALKKLQVNIGNNAAANFRPGLLLQQQQMPIGVRFIGPSFVAGGLLSTPRGD